MARIIFGTSTGDLAVYYDPTTGDLTTASGTTLTPYATQTGGTPLTGIQTPSGVGISVITIDSTGHFRFLGPDGYTGSIWLDDGTNPRVEVFPGDLGERLGGGGGGGGVTDHGLLTGLADDDHTQYLNTTRADARYYTKTTADATFADAVHTHVAADTTTGVFAPARLGTGTPTASNYLSGDGTWKASSGGTYATMLAATTLTLWKSGAGAWPARPTARTDIVVQWVGPAPAPVVGGTGNAVAGVDIWIQDLS